MKRILLVFGFLALTAASAFAERVPVPAPSVIPVPGEIRDLFRFDLNCYFDNNVKCTAQSRIFKFINDSATAVTPQWLTNLLAISCDYQLIYADGAVLRRQNREDGVKWEIFSANGAFEIDLKDNPFDPNGAKVYAALEFDHRRIPGTCEVRATDVGGR